jgi:hypothetical protein
MAVQVPFDTVATFLGRKPAGTGTRDGKSFDWGEKPQFAVTLPDGSVSLWDIRGQDLDNSSPPFDHGSLKPNDRVRLQGSAVLADRGSDSGSYLRLTTATFADKASRPVAVTG